MFKLADLIVQITGDSKGLSTSLRHVHAELLGMSGIGGQVGAGIAHGITGPLLGLSSTATLAGASIAAAFGVAAFGGMVKCVQAASSLKEAIGKTTEVFGSSSDIVIRQAEELARSFGLSKRASLDAAGAFGQIIQGAAIGTKEAAKFSAQLLKMAADASRFNDVTFEEALVKLRAGLGGEMEPLRAWGVSLKEEAVQAKVVAMGLTAGNRAISERMKMLARMQLMQEQLAKSAGTLERESAGWGAQVEKLSGNFENLSAGVGDSLMPAFAGALGKINWLLSQTTEHLDTIKSMARALSPHLWGLYAASDALSETPEGQAEQENRLKGIDARNEQLRAQAAADQAAGHKTKKGFQGGLEEYAKKVQEAAMGGKDVAKKQLDTSNKMLDVLKQIKDMTGPKNAAYALQPNVTPWF